MSSPSTASAYPAALRSAVPTCSPYTARSRALRHRTGDVEQEKERFDHAIRTRATNWPRWWNTSGERATGVRGFPECHLMILGDSTLSQAPKTLIDTQRCNAEWALTQQTEELLDSSTAWRTLPARAQGRRRASGRACAKALLASRARFPRRGIPKKTAFWSRRPFPADVILFKQHRLRASSPIWVESLRTLRSSHAALHPVDRRSAPRAQLVHENELLIVDAPTAW